MKRKTSTAEQDLEGLIVEVPEDKSHLKVTPMMQQYLEIRKKLPVGTLLFFRLGDFYELFFEDAERASRILGLTLTHRSGNPMAGIPFHAAATYLRKLLEQGWKVGICDQLETPQAGKIVKRALTRIYTPGTILEDDQLEGKNHHYILALNIDNRGIHAAWLEFSLGEIQVTSGENIGDILSVLSALNPREILLPENYREEWKHLQGTWRPALEMLLANRLVTEIPHFYFNNLSAVQVLKETLGVLSLNGFGISEKHPALGSAGALVYYASQTLCRAPKNICRLSEVHFEQSLKMDATTLRHLEIFESVRGNRQGSLLEAIDRTQTAAGGRLLKNFLTSPLLNLEEIRRRQQCVEEFYEGGDATVAIQWHLSQTKDFLRILSRIQNRLRNPRELGGLKESLRQLPQIGELLRNIRATELLKLWGRVADFSDLTEYLDRALAEELPNDISTSGFIREGFNEKLDFYRQTLSTIHEWLEHFERQEQIATGIKNLRIKYSGTFGYFIEVTKSNLSYVPAHYVRRQTVVNGERYTTEELRKKEAEIFEAQRSILELEQSLLEEVVERVLQDAEAIRTAGEIIGELDVFAGWGALARQWNYVRPVVDDSDEIRIQNGRHPVIEQMLANAPEGLGGSHQIVPNDTLLSSTSDQILLITGPNMAGKSTYIRQVAILILMAQMGCWIPAESAKIGIIDRLFTRIGANDDLSRGQSTFMVEMEETAHILRNTTARSLVILDEIGRGTSTYDGLSIAWAVIENLHGVGPCGPKTLFATHYHEITQLEKLFERIRNYHISVHEEDDTILFLRKLEKGGADRSYGIQVAKLAGLPDSVIQRAKVILKELESEGSHLTKKLS